MSSDESRRAEMRQVARNTYNEYSILPFVVSLVDFEPSRDSFPFHQFAQKIKMPEEWLAPNFIAQPVFQDLGRIIGISERKYIIDNMLEKVSPIKKPELTLEIVGEQFERMKKEGHNPTALLLPLELHREFYSWNIDDLIRYSPQENLVFDGHPIRIIWSSKFTPFKRSFMVSTDFGKWISKPSVHERFQIIYDRVDSADTVTAQTIFNFEITDMSAITGFEILGLKPVEY